MRLPRPWLPAAALLALVPGTGRAAEGLPQLDVTTYSSQLFWLVAMFVIVYLFMRFVGVPRVAAILDERHRRIGGDLGEAERLRNEADVAMKAYEATLAEAHGAARKLLADTHEKNVAILAQQTQSASAEFDRRVAEAVERIKAAQGTALQGIRDMALGLASDITAKVAGHAPASDMVARAVEAAAGTESHG